ncbi:hypothetical protein B0H10DRAFT_1961160 [Mycena sp. CBHHK59/15]|nr:hypothetical protein B0H10DRAFT_1961160 [Mycena sp. CBHHK59/15]
MSSYFVHPRDSPAITSPPIRKISPLNAEETRHALLAYAEGFWPPPRVVPPGWSADWTKWDYLLTFFGFSPYFLRLPQIEMLVNIRYGVPGAARPLMYSDDGPTRRDRGRRGRGDTSGKGGGGRAGGFMLDCSTFELLAFADDGEAAHALPETVDELIERIGADIDSVPYTQLAPDEAGEAALQRVLARDASVIPLLETDFLGYAPKPTTPAEELPDEEAEARRRTKIEAAIADARAFVAETEEELRLDQEDLQELGEGGVLNIELEQEANRRMTAALDDAKAKLAKWEALYQQSYGGENKASHFDTKRNARKSICCCLIAPRDVNASRAPVSHPDPYDLVTASSKIYDLAEQAALASKTVRKVSAFLHGASRFEARYADYPNERDVIESGGILLSGRVWEGLLEVSRRGWVCGSDLRHGGLDGGYPNIGMSGNLLQMAASNWSQSFYDMAANYQAFGERTLLSSMNTDAHLGHGKGSVL